MFRTDEDGALKIDMIVQMVQSQLVNIDPAEAGLGTFPMRGGVTLMIAQQPLHAGRRGDPEIRYAIAKHLSGDREIRQRAAYAAQGGLGPGEQKINFGLLHGI
jgi:hypothetical protein